MQHLRSLLIVTCVVVLLDATNSFAQQKQPGQSVQDLRNRNAQLVANRTNAIARTPQVPFPPLSAKHNSYIDQLLKYWEGSSAQVKRYQCQFTRWEYDGIFGPRANAKGVLPAKTIATGIIRYEAPDKGMYEVEKLYDYAPPRVAGGEPQYPERKENNKEKWICDGVNVYEMDFNQKKMLVIPLPPESRGKAISDGPLPFLFGVEAEKVKKRYWLRVITPKNAEGEYWLEAWPKRLHDAQSFKKVEVIIDEKDFLPKAIQIFGTQYDPRTNQSRTAFTFEKREKNKIDLNIFKAKFHKPKLEKGWKTEVLNPQPQAQARRPAAMPRK